MPTVEDGTFQGRLESQARIPVPDEAGHELSVFMIAGRHRTSDPVFNGMRLTYMGTADLVNGAGIQAGYFFNEDNDGNRATGRFDATSRADNDAMIVEGAWNLSGGTGKFSKMTGGGKFTARVVGNAASMTWNGTYEILEQPPGDSSS